MKNSVHDIIKYLEERGEREGDEAHYTHSEMKWLIEQSWSRQQLLKDLDRLAFNIADNYSPQIKGRSSIDTAIDIMEMQRNMIDSLRKDKEELNERLWNHKKDK